MIFDELVAHSVKHNASDLHLSSGHKPCCRIDGKLVHFGEAALTAQLMESMMMRTLTLEQTEIFRQQNQLDYALQMPDGTRLRGNLFLQSRGLSAVFRHIKSDIPTPEALLLPPVTEQFLQYQSGLVLVTGATGSGKSTTLAALVERINAMNFQHIITLEDPIEFVYRSQCSLIQQREIGTHVDSFPEALRGALREDPDIILLGELRDPDTIRLALTAAETGHLVLASLHTRSAVQAVERLVDVFDAEEKALVRTQLAGSLKAIISQQLLPARAGGRVAAYEILIITPGAANLIREGKQHQIANLLQTGSEQGMQTMEQCIQRYRTMNIL